MKLKRSWIAIVLTAAAACAALALQNSSQHEVLFEKARFAMETKGDLKGAIELFDEIIKKHPNMRDYAAKSLYLMGTCYEKLGEQQAQQARAAFQRIIADYPDQTEEARLAKEKLLAFQEVKLARERLAVLTQQAGDAAKPRFRKIQIPTKLPIFTSGRLSPDGRKLAFISEGALWVVPIQGKSDPDIAGAPVRLTEPMNAWDNVNVSIAWSGDGKWIGFRTGSANNSRNPVEALYIVPAEGGKPKRLPITSKDWPIDVFTLRYALSPGAENFFFADGTKTENLRIYSMAAKGGERRPVTEPITREPALSPDGSRIAYIKMLDRPDGNVVSHQIWVRPVRGGDAVLISEVSSSTLCPIWSPDGTKVAFLSIEGNSWRRPYLRLWIVPLADDGKPAAAVSKFDLPDFESPRGISDFLAGWTPDNKIGILIPTPQVVALYTVPAEGGKAVQLTTKYTVMPRWTPGGTRIYFDGAHGGDRANLEYVPGDGGKVTRLSVLPGNIQPVFPSQLSISADGRTLCYAGFFRSGNPDPGPHLFTVPVEGGTASRVAIEPATDNTSPLSSPVAPEWSPDGTKIAFLGIGKTDPGSQTFNIFVVPRGGGKAQQVSTDADRVQRSDLAWSPDGELIAFFGQDSTLRLIPAAGGSSRILAPSQSGPWDGIDWSPDGKRIAYTTPSGLQVVSRDGGEPTTIATGLDARHLKVDWSPDGKRIAFTASKGGEPELWLMEDFLHLVNNRK